MNLLLVLIFSLALSPAVLSRAGMMEEETKISAALQSQLKAKLDDMLGAGRASVWVKAELSLDPRIKQAVERSLEPPAPAPAPVETEPAETQTAPVSKRLNLPGFLPKSEAPAPAKESKVIIIQHPPQPAQAPAVGSELALAAGTRVKKIGVKISLDRGVPAKKEAEIRALVLDLIGSEPAIERVKMPTVWHRIWGDPGLVSGLAAKAALALAGIAVALLALWVFTRAFNKMGQKIDKAVDLLPARGLDPYEGRFLIDVPLQKIGLLHFLLHQEPAENIAMVVPHLRDDARRAFLELLPQEKTVEVLASLESVRFVEKDVLERLKNEIEGRVNSAVGGLEQIAKIVEGTELASRSEILEILKSRKPELYAALQGRLLEFKGTGGMTHGR
ncbi:MAG: hypothetical protein A3A86_03620 [Elusimicrobia bacterium RIFCSPLOWO2_01_FULL_60_11]|nr:MAG: hypothetical protein A3A86_03620 [Elusimicrobia bacterium RIFCSPLOWO2_01_FULL_60_11]